MRSASRFLLSVASLAVLTACLDDNSAISARAESTEKSRALYAASALKNYAMINATGLDTIGEVRSGPDGLRGLLCAKYDGKGGGVFLTWYDAASRPSGVHFIGALSRELSARNIAQNVDGRLTQNGAAVSLPTDCPLPSMRNGSPVIILPVSIPSNAFTAGVKEEKQPRPCPDGQIGAAVYKRSVEYTKEGRRIEGPWLLDELAGCADAVEVGLTVTDGAAPMRSSGNGSEAELLLAANLPDSCTRVTLSKRVGKREAGQKEFNTCDFVEAAAPVVAPSPVEVPKPPKVGPLPITERGVCEGGLGGVAGIIRIPATDKAGYQAAIADITARLRVTFSSVAIDCVRVLSSTPWPFLQAFYANTPEGWRVINRRYSVTVDLSWQSLAGAGDAWDEFHKVRGYQWFVWPSLAVIPQTILSHPHHWAAADVSAWPRYSVSTIALRTYPVLIGPNTSTGYPIPYQSTTTWADTAEDAALFAAADWPQRCATENLGCASGNVWRDGLDFINDPMSEMDLKLWN